MDFPNFFFIFLVKNSRFANMKKLFHFMHLEIWTKVPTLGLQITIRVNVKVVDFVDLNSGKHVQETERHTGVRSPFVQPHPADSAQHSCIHQPPDNRRLK